MTEKEQREALVQLIEDGELDDSLPALQEAIDDRNKRRKDVLLRQIKGVWGEEAQIVIGGEHSATASAPAPHPTQTATPAVAGDPIAPRAQYVPQEGSQIPAPVVDRMQYELPGPIISAGTGDFTAVPDPMAAGPGE